MSNFIKFFFLGRNVELADLLNRIGVPAYSVEGGILLDLDALDAIPVSQLPVWVWRNYDDIHNPFKTRKCVVGEWPVSKKPERYTTLLVVRGKEGQYARSAGTDSLAAVKKLAKVRADHYRDRSCREEYIPTAVVVVDCRTGEIVHTVQV